MYEVGDIVEIIDRGGGWDGVQAIVIHVFDKKGLNLNYVDLRFHKDSPVPLPNHYKGKNFIGMWRIGSLNLVMEPPTPETYEID